MSNLNECGHCPDCDHYIRLPGLFRRWEFEQVIQGSDEFHITAAGAAQDGSELFTVHCRERSAVVGAAR